MSEHEIFKEHDDDDENKNNDWKKKVSEKSSDHHLDHDCGTTINYSELEISKEDESDSSSKKMMIKKKAKEEVVVSGLLVPDDVMLEVFLRLPPISVLKFLFASKNWYNLIFKPSFLQNHAIIHQYFHSSHQPSSSSRRPGLIFCPSSGSSRKGPPVYAAMIPKEDQQTTAVDDLKTFLDRSLLAFKQKFPNSFIVDSCNGLLLSCETSFNSDDEKYKIFNPMINQHKEVPIMDLFGTFDDPNQVHRTVHPHIVFDPSLSAASVKVLVMLIAPPYNHFQLHVYSSDTGLWKFLTTFHCDPENTLFQEGVMFDGVFYWFRNHDSICYDVVSDKVWSIPLPAMSDGYTNRHILYVGECGGRLRLIQQHHSSDELLANWLPFRFKIIEMEKKLDQPPTWTEKSLINIKVGYDHDLMQEVNPQSIQSDCIKLMHLYETEEGEEAVLLLSNDCKRIVSFNTASETFGNKLTIPYFEDYDGVYVLPFTPTLFPLST